MFKTNFSGHNKILASSCSKNVVLNHSQRT